MFLVLIFLTNCEDSKSNSKNTKGTNTKTTVKSTTKSIDTIKSKPVPEKPEFPVLNDSLAMEFFLEYQKEHKENKVRLTTTFGEIDILLFNKTKFHRANFIYLTKRGYFDGTQFYRVINNFIVQAGNTDDKKVKRKRRRIGKYLLPKDTKRGYKHDRGVISMPSSEIDNPYKLASPYEFFIVQQRGGAHFLDGDYTIFGKVIRGMDVVDKIAAVETDNVDWPLHNIYIKKAEIIE